MQITTVVEEPSAFLLKKFQLDYLYYPRRSKVLLQISAKQDVIGVVIFGMCFYPPL